MYYFEGWLVVKGGLIWKPGSHIYTAYRCTPPAPFTNTTVYLDVIEKPEEYQNETPQKRGKKLKEFVYERIPLPGGYSLIWAI